MDRPLNILCSICARGGSKGVPGKNIRMLLGKPLIAHSILQAVNSGLFSDIAISSDDDEILRTAKEYGASILIKRPPELARDDSPKIPVIRHCLLEAEKISNRQYDVSIDLDCTSPLRTTDDIQNCLTLLKSDNCTNVLTGTPARRSPYFTIVEIDASGIVTLSKPHPSEIIIRRQDAPMCYDLNASVYAWWRDELLQHNSLYLRGTKLYEMPAERSVDIDSELDFLIVETLAQKSRI